MCVCVYVLMHVCSCVLMYLCAYMLMNTLTYQCSNMFVYKCVNVLYKVIHGTFSLQILPLFRPKTLRKTAIFQDLKAPLSAAISSER